MLQAEGRESFKRLERVSCGEFLEARDRRGEGEECREQVGVAFVADGQAAVAGEPGGLVGRAARCLLGRVLFRVASPNTYVKVAGRWMAVST